MNNIEAFDICTEEQIESALRKAWDKTGMCSTCGWWSAFYEVTDDLWPTEESGTDLWKTFCHSKDNPDCSGGIYLQPDFLGELKELSDAMDK